MSALELKYNDRKHLLCLLIRTWSANAARHVTEDNYKIGVSH